MGRAAGAAAAEIAGADRGCGLRDRYLSVLLAEYGHLVSGVDVGPETVRRVRAKALATGPVLCGGPSSDERYLVEGRHRA